MDRKAGQIQVQKAKMAMAVWGKNRHYRWAEIRREHFLKTASDCKLPDAAMIIDGLIEAAPSAIDKVGSRLPRGFPLRIADAIFDGLRKAVKTLSR